MLSPPNEQVRAGQIARDSIKLAMSLCRDDIDGLRLDKEIEQFIRDEGGKPALKGYHPHFADEPYKHTICLAVNQDVVHGIPHKPVLTTDLVTVDLVVEYDGWFADTARTFTTSGDTQRKQFAHNSSAIFTSALDMVLPEQSINLFGMMVENAALMHGYGVIKEYCGHGIGQTIHSEPQVCNHPTIEKLTFQAGRSYAVEPLLSINPTYTLREYPKDGYSINSNCLVSHNEDTLFVGSDRVINLTGNES